MARKFINFIKLFLVLTILIFSLQSWTKAEDIIDMIFGVKLNNDVSEYAKIENGKTIDSLPNIYTFDDKDITIERDSTFDAYYLRTDENYKVLIVSATKFVDYSYNDLFKGNCKEEKKGFISDLSNSLDINSNDFDEYFYKNKKGEKFLWNSNIYTYKDEDQKFRVVVNCIYFRPIEPESSGSKIIGDLSIYWLTEDYYRNYVLPRVELIKSFDDEFIKTYLIKTY